MRIYSLNGEQWLMRQAGQERWRQATVPGSVYADLMRDGTLPDPFYRENELEAFALLENDFVYQRVFEAEETMLQSRKVLLRCEGLDTLAHVSLNGQPVGAGKGRSKKEAEQMAAKAAIAKLNQKKQ